MPRHSRKRLRRTADGSGARPVHRRRNIRWGRLVLLIFTLGCLFVLAACADIFYRAVSEVPALADPNQQLGTSSQIFDRNGQLVTAVPGGENRQPVDVSQMPPLLKDAFIATEDRTFYSNIGVSFRGIGRAVTVDVTHHFARSSLQGASTISQQLARMLYLSQRDTLSRKLKEAVLAIELNRRFTKPQVLGMYLNDVDLGEHAHGVQAAALTYFDQPDLSKLTLPQVALLAGLPQAPSSYDPFVNPKAAQTRRDEVLQYMVTAGYITQAQATAAAAQPISVTRGSSTAGQSTNYPDPWFVDAVIQQLENQFNMPEQEVLAGGLKIYTTLDPKIEDAAQQSVTKHMAALPGLQAGVAVMDQHTGDVVAIVGGVQHTTQFGKDRAIDIARQPGSSMKPLADYIPALESRLTAGTVVDDVPSSYPNGTGGQYIPQDDQTPYYGLTTLTEALRRSVNTVAIAVLSHVGVQKGFNNAVAMGLPLNPKEDDYLPLAIGGISATTCCSPLDMADAYSTIANGGMHVTPRMITKVVGPAGDVLINNPVKFKQVVDPRVAFVMTKMLEAVNNPPSVAYGVPADTGWDSNWGTGYDATVHDNVPGWPSAGKTGTTENNQDAWFVGFTPLYSAAVWIGYDYPKAMANLYGGTYAGPIWQDIMVSAVSGQPVQDFPKPPGVVEAQIDAKCAPWNVCSPSTLTPQEWTRPEWFIAGTQPTPATSQSIWVQKQVTQTSPPLLWSPLCGGAPITRTFLDREPLGLSWAQPIAAYFGWKLSADQYLPVDDALTPPQQSCTRAPTPTGSVGSPGGVDQNGCSALWAVSVALGQPASPSLVCIYQGKPARIVFSATDGQSHQVQLQGLGQQATVPGDGTPVTVTVTPTRVGETLILLDGSPVGRVQVQAGPPPSATSQTSSSTAQTSSSTAQQPVPAQP